MQIYWWLVRVTLVVVLVLLPQNFGLVGNGDLRRPAPPLPTALPVVIYILKIDLENKILLVTTFY